MNLKYKTILLAGLLCDLNDFTVGQIPPLIETVRSFWDMICDADLLLKIISKDKAEGDNGESEKASELIELASRYSFGLGSPHENNGDKFTAMSGILTTVELDQPLPRVGYYKMAELGPMNAYPCEHAILSEKAYEEQVKQVVYGLRKLTAFQQPEFQQVYSHILSLLRQWAWCIPCSRDYKTDISLYEHMRITSAISACLYLYQLEHGWENLQDASIRKFKLIAADFTGIQKYIFGITSVGGVAKRLRARSFFVASMIKGVALRFLQELELPLANLLMTAGGKFWLLAPNTDEVSQRLQRTRDELERWLLEKYCGQVSLIIGLTDLTGSELSSFDDASQRCSESLANAKMSVFSNILTCGDNWCTEEFLRPNTITGSACPSCGKHDTAGQEVCEQCNRDKNLGTRLANADYVVYKQNAGERYYPLLPSMHLGVFDKPPEKNNQAILNERLNNPILSVTGGAVSFSFMTNHIPLVSDLNTEKKKEVSKPENERLIADFEMIAQKAQGKKLLAYLKADVDNMSSAYFYGLRREGENVPVTVSRQATMSSTLDLFFSGVLNHLLTNEYRDCYTIFSGGDDLFVLGPWNRIIDLAVTLVDEFKKFTGGNRNLTLSAGILLAKDSFPIYSAYREVEELLDKAKNEEAVRGQVPKNQLAVFDGLIKWDELPEALRSAKQLSEWLKEGNKKVANAAFVRHLIAYSNMYREYLEKDHISGLRFLSLLCYDIARNLPSLRSEGEAGRYREWAESLIHGLKVNESALKNIWFVAKYALTATRDDKTVI